MSEHDPDGLIRSLTQNPTEPRAMRTSNERLLDILQRNMDNPMPRAHWYARCDNRTVQIVTGREHVWTMCTTAVRLSLHFYQSWVT